MNPKSLLKQSGLVLSFKALDKYISFIETKKLSGKIKYKTATHHILPKTKQLPFHIYKNLKKHKWNSAHLYHKDHLIAHKLLLDVIDSFSMRYAYMKMVEGYVKNGQKIDLNFYQKIKETVVKENTIVYKNYLDTLKDKGEYEDYIKATNSKRQKSLNKITENGKTVRENALNARSVNVTRIDENGNSIAILGAKKGIKTQTTEFILNGETTSIKKEALKKFSKTIQEQVFYNGNYITKAQLRNIKATRTRRLNSQRYRLFDITGKYFGVFYVGDINKLAPTLRKSSKNNALYMSDYLRNKKLRDSNLKGLYVEAYFGFEPNSNINYILSYFSV